MLILMGNSKLLIINKVQNKILTQKEAAQALRITPRQVRRIVSRIKNEGIKGALFRHKGGSKQLSDQYKDQVLQLVKEKYHDFGPTFAVEKLHSPDFDTFLKKRLVSIGF